MFSNALMVVEADWTDDRPWLWSNGLLHEHTANMDTHTHTHTHTRTHLSCLNI